MQKSSPTPHTQWPLHLLMLVGLLLLCVAVYSPVHGFGFLKYDDPTYVWQNSHVLSGLSAQSLHYAFTANFGGWSPLVWISYLLDRQFLGVKPGPMHVENAAWHALGGVVLWILLTEATGARYRSWLVAALFICHPMHVESVAWIAERKDVLSTSLLLAAMLAYVRYCKTSSPSHRVCLYGLMLLLFSLSLMTKSMGVTLPLLLVLLDYWPLRRFPKPKMDVATARWISEKLPLLAITIVFAIAALHAQRTSGAMDAAASLPWSDRIDNAIVCYVIYGMKLLVPTGLAAFYPHPGSRPLPQVFSSGGVILLLLWLGIRNRAKAPYLITGLLWFLIALLPVIGLIQVGGQAMADRYSYLPSIGLFIAVLWGANDLLRKVGVNSTQPIGRWISPVLAATLLVVFTGIARQTVWYWKDDETLFSHCYDVTGPNPVACFALGVAAYSHGQLQLAVDDFNIVISQDPGNHAAYKLLGDLWLQADLTKAIGYYSQAVLLKPDKVDYRISFAAALTTRGDLKSLMLARQQLLRALQIDPAEPRAKIGLQDVIARIHQKQIQPTGDQTSSRYFRIFL